MILSCQHISKAFGTDQVLSDISFHIEAGEKAAIVGVNGAGKSTLLKIITGEMAPDEGLVSISRGLSIGYLAQQDSVTPCLTIYEEVRRAKEDLIRIGEQIDRLQEEIAHLSGNALEAALKSYADLTHTYEMQNGFAIDSEITGVLVGLGFSQDTFDTPVEQLSGGQKTRVCLARLLLTRPDLLLLDEPTNHLDMTSIAWLETFLKNYRGAVIIVAHDRYFLDKVVTKIIEIERCRGQVFTGNYTAYAAKKAQQREILMKAWLNQQQEVAHQEAVITKLRSFNREKSIKRAESREKMLARIERLEKPMTADEAIRLSLTPAVTSGNEVLKTIGLTKAFASNRLFENIDMDIRRGERVALIGSNGTGKTTLLKIINGLCDADSGQIIIGTKVQIGYYDQEHQLLTPEKTIFDEISDAWPHLDNTRIRTVLAAFLFTGDDVFKRIADLSGGERGRVALAKLMLSDANFLILDEPTNHLDILSKEVLENALRQFPGTVLYVSHDRYFINTTATRILALTDGGLNSYPGNYDDYLEHLEHPQQSASSGGFAETAAASASGVSQGKADYLQQKEAAAKARKLKNDLEKTEKAIEQIEARLAKLDADLELPDVCSDPEKLLEIHHEQERLNADLESYMAQWEVLAEQSEA